MVSARDRIQAARESALRKAQQAPRPVLHLAMTFFREFTAIEPFDRAMTLAAQAFTSIFPLLLTLVALVDHGSGSIGDQIATTLKLPDSVRKALDDALPPDSQQFFAFGIVSLLIVLTSATSFSRALGRMYAKAWHKPPSGWNGGWRWVVVILAVTGSTVVTQLVNHSVGAPAEAFGALALTFLINAAVWTWVPWLLLVRRVTILELLPAAALMGIGAVVLSIASRIYMPHALTIASEHFGSFGIAFTFIGWLFIDSFVLIIATVLGAVIVHDEFVRGIVTRVRDTLPGRPGPA